METIYDWVSMAIFGALVVLFLHRSTTDEDPKDTTLHYLPPAIGCAVANYVGNQGQGAASALIVIGVILYIIMVLKPFGLDLWPRRR
jgi:hypothetical protein